MTLDEIKRGEGYELEFKLVPNEDRIQCLNLMKISLKRDRYDRQANPKRD